MATPGIYGRYNIHAGAVQSVYTPGGQDSGQATLNLVNRGSVATRVDVQIDSSANAGTGPYIEYRTTIKANEVLEITGLMLSYNQFLTVTAYDSSVSAVVWGVDLGETTTAAAIPLVMGWSTGNVSVGTVNEGIAAAFAVTALDPVDSATITDYTVSSGSLPTGLSLNALTGAITGTASAVAATTTFSFAVTATSSAGRTATKTHSITVNNVLPFDFIYKDEYLPGQTEGFAVRAGVSARDAHSAAATITYAVTSGALPVGVTLGSTTGQLSGTAPTVASDTTYTFTITATSSVSGTISRQYRMIVSNVSYATGTGLWFDWDAADYLATYTNGQAVPAGTITSRTAAATVTAAGTVIMSHANGGYLDLGQAAGYFRITASSDWATLNAATSISLVTWFQSDSTSRQVLISRFASSGVPNQWNHIVDPTGDYHHNSTGAIAGTSGDLNTNSWYPYTWTLSVWVYDVTTGYATWYQNDAQYLTQVFYGTDAGAGLSVAGGSTGTIGFGTRADVAETLRGRLGIARIYTRALTRQEIRNEWSSYKYRFFDQGRQNYLV